MRQLKIGNSITPRDGEILQKYLQDIGREEMLTPEQEVELAARIHQGDKAALAKLVRANLRIVVSVAQQYQNQGMSLLDIINEGNLGLIKAAEKFAETRGFKFISYAVWWIRPAILQAMADFEQANKRRASDEELAEVLDMPVDKVRESLRSSGRSVSVDQPITDGEDTTLLDVMPGVDQPSTDAGLNHESLAVEIGRVLKQLPGRESEILKSAFGIGCPEMSREELGEKFDLTRERVRQIKEKALRHLKSQHSAGLKPYLG